jgi:CIC family chloride channel protein
MMRTPEAEPPHPVPDEPPPHGHAWSVLFLAALVTGLLVGAIGCGFLLVLRWGDGLRAAFIEQARTWNPWLGWLAVCAVVAAATALAAWLVERVSPAAAGSGIPRVESVLRGEQAPSDTWIIPVKILGGWLALSAGLALGREGPTVQIGAVLGERVGRRIKGLKDGWMFLMSAGAGAGLATAFNAPVGGTLFILEEVLRRMSPLGFVLTATACTSAVWVQRAIFELPRDYAMGILQEPPINGIWLYLALGLGIGVLGVAYNRLLLALLRWLGRQRLLPFLPRAALIGVAVGTVAWFAPDWVGGGDDITQSVLHGGSLAGTLIALVTVRFLLGPLSYAAGTPGGLFAPIMALGALLGVGIGTGFQHLAPELVPQPLAFALAGMATFFTATVRAPLTGIVICLEMAGNYVMFFPMLVACLAAYLVAEILQDVPIYDALARLAAPAADPGARPP